MSTEITPTCDSKTRFYSGNKNTYGLLPGPLSLGGTCPCATEGHEGCLGIEKGRTLPSCYVYRTISYRPAVGSILKHNTDLLMSCEGFKRQQLMVNEFSRFVNAWNLRKKRQDDIGAIPYYRIHWSGDCPDLAYANDLAAAMRLFDGQIEFWGYSRALFTVPVMLGIPNVTWYVSMDPVNRNASVKFLMAFCPEVIRRDSMERMNVSFAYMASEPWPEFTKMAPCPSDSGKVPHAEACRQCRLCLTGKPIFFKRK